MVREVRSMDHGKRSAKEAQSVEGSLVFPSSKPPGGPR